MGKIMNRNDLLDKLAMEMPVWPNNVGQMNAAVQVFGWRPVVDNYDVYLLDSSDTYQICGEHWSDRRMELINEPEDSEAPSWATHKYQGPTGFWYWSSCALSLNEDATLWRSSGGSVLVAKRGRIIPGHDWRTTLSEVSTMTTTAHEDQFAPEPPHEADARMLDAQLAADMKQPRYKDKKGEDWIDEFARTATLDEFRGAMRFTIGKYNRRVGKKDDVIKEVVKMRDYCQRWEAYERELSQ